MLCGSGKGEVMRVVQRWVDHRRFNHSRLKAIKLCHQMVNVHEDWFTINKKIKLN